MSRSRCAAAIVILALLIGTSLANVVERHWYFNWDAFVMWAFVVAVFVAVFRTALHRQELPTDPKWLRTRDPDGLGLGLRRVAAGVMSFMFPHGGRCGRCAMPWYAATPHMTDVNDFLGERVYRFFALCETCWRDLTPLQRWPYYAAAYTMFIARAEIEGQDWRSDQVWLTDRKRLLVTILQEEEVVEEDRAA